MKISDYSYILPDELIADFPPEERGTTRLLVLDRATGEILDKKYADVVDFLEAGDVLVLNNTRVIKSRLKVFKASNSAERELMILERHGDEDYFAHKVMYRGSLNVGDELLLADPKTTCGEGGLPRKGIVVTEILGDGLAVVRSEENLLAIAEKFGTVPLPPYMNREATKADIERYQTVFADSDGSAAAPTASLNMTDEILERLKAKGVVVKYLTLHVGLGTFLPIRTDVIEEHKMHSEYFEIPDDTLRAIAEARESGARVVALGTTVARTLEYAHHRNGGYKSIISHLDEKVKRNIAGEADIFIYPGYKFEVVDVLLTNFHAPKSTVLMLAAAFAGWDNLKNAYEHAIAEKYHFLSYGDSMLIR